jgi:Kef-type K+ transport system membrane component KefB
MQAFFDISLLLALATVIALVMQWLRLPLLLGHILTGILAGPAVFNMLQHTSVIETFSQLGITALLFVVGLSLSPHVIREVGKVALATGLGQILFTTLFGFGLGMLLGYSWMTSLFLAVALTFSSTIIIMKLLGDRGDEHTLYGKISVGFLLVQDLVATIILILASTLGSDGTLLQAIVKTLALLGGMALVMTLVARTILPRLSRLFAQSQEFLFLFSLGWGVGIAALCYHLGLSIEIGGLAAGVALATSPYRFEITAKMRLIRDFFLIMFFVLLGSHLTWTSIGEHLPHAAILSVFILIGNPLIVIAIMGWLRYSKKTAFFAGLTVAQISEFSLILLMLVAQKGYISQEVVSLATIVGIVTIAGSTLMILHADQLYTFLAPVLSLFERAHPIPDRQRRERYDAFVFGCHRVGNEFLRPLANKRLRSLVVDFDPSVIERLQQREIPCRYGDAHDNEFLDELDLASAKVIISTIPDMEINLLLLQKAQKSRLPHTLVIVSAHTPEQAQRLYDAGAAYVILPHFLGGNHTAMLLEEYGLAKLPFERQRKRHLKYLERHLASSSKEVE